MIVKGCCESNWWRKRLNKTNRTQYGAHTSVSWFFFFSVLEQKMLKILNINKWLWKAVVKKRF